jgi:hypothetical protein
LRKPDPVTNLKVFGPQYATVSVSLTLKLTTPGEAFSSSERTFSCSNQFYFFSFGANWPYRINIKIRKPLKVKSVAYQYVGILLKVLGQDLDSELDWNSFKKNRIQMRIGIKTRPISETLICTRQCSRSGSAFNEVPESVFAIQIRIRIQKGKTGPQKKLINFMF